MSGQITNQTIFGVFYAVNISQSFPTDPELTQEINTYLSTNASKFQGTWSIVWGPATQLDPTKSNPSVVAIATYIAYNKDLNTYIVACSGTNFASTYCFQTYDADTKPIPLPWAIHPGAAYIHSGFNASFSVVTTLTSPATGGKTILQFLQENANGANIYVGGHSLGGATAPLVGLYLNTNKLPNVNVFTAAAPSTGNADFVKILTSVFTSGKNLLQFRNDLDAVPCAFSLNNMPNIYSIPGLYGNTIPTSTNPTGVNPNGYNAAMSKISPFLDNLTTYNFLGAPIYYEPHPATAFASPCKVPSIPTGLLDFFSTVGTQHVTAYQTYFEVPALPQAPKQGGCSIQ